jgi:Phosphotransferase enzyme family
MASVNLEPKRDRYRMIVLQTDGAQVLLVPKGTDFVLPEVEIPAFQRVAEHLTAAVRLEWGQQILCLFSLASETTRETPDAASYCVAEALDRQDSAGPSRWVSVQSLRQESFADARDHEALSSSLAQCRSEETNPKRGPFEKLSWLPEAKAWIAEAIERSGLRLSGPFRQLNASPTFTLMRFETNGPAVWFKAVGEPNLQEFPISRELARYFPGFVPTILAAREDWNAWLTLEMEGTHPDENSEIGIWTTMGRTLADLQIASIGSALHLIGAGCRDARIPALRDLVDPFLQAMAGLMERQTKPTPPPLSQPELQALRGQLWDALLVLEESGIPDTLGHLDFNPGNVLVGRDRCVFLDWAEGCVGHPFLTFEYLLEHLRRIQPHHTSWQRGVVSSYGTAWRSFLGPDEIIQALAVAPLVAVFAYAAVGDRWREARRLERTREAAYLRSVTRRMKREVDALAGPRIDRSVACLG